MLREITSVFTMPVKKPVGAGLNSHRVCGVPEAGVGLGGVRRICRSEPARDGLENTAHTLNARDIVNVHRRQAPYW